MNKQSSGQIANQGNRERESQDNDRDRGKGQEGGRLNQASSQSGSDRSSQQIESGDRQGQKPPQDGAFGKDSEMREQINRDKKKDDKAA